MVGAMIMVPAALCMLSLGCACARCSAVVAFGSGALLFFLTSKGQHAALAPVVVGGLIDRSMDEIRPKYAGHGALAGGAWLWCLIAGTDAGSSVETPYWYKAENRFTLVFYKKLLPASGTPSQRRGRVGAFAKRVCPISDSTRFCHTVRRFDPAWLLAFSQRGSYGKVATFCAKAIRGERSPLCIGIWTGSLEAQARRSSPIISRKPAAPPLRKRGRSGSWSALQYLVLADMADAHGDMVRIGAGGWSRCSRGAAGSELRQAHLAWTLGLSRRCSGQGEFCIASLADARETDRHLVLFHLFTDFTIFLALVYAMAGSVVY